MAYPKQVFTFNVTVVHENSEVAYSQVFAASMNACIAVLNQSAIAQREAPCVAMTVAYAVPSRTMRTDVHTASDELIDIVVSMAANSELNFLMLTTTTSASSRYASAAGEDVVQTSASASCASDAIFSPKFEQVVRQTASQIIQTTYQ